MQEQQQQQQNVQPKKKKKKDNPIGIIIILCIAILSVACFPIWFAQYGDSTWRVVTPALTVVCQPKTVVDYEQGVVRTEPELKVYFFPNNFKTLDELRALESAE